MPAAVARLGGPQVEAFRGGAEPPPTGTGQVLVAGVGAAHKSLQGGGGGIRQPQEAGPPAAGPRQHLIGQLRAQGAEGQVGEAFASGGLRGERPQLQQGAVLGATAAADGIGQLHLIELLVAPQAHQQRLLAAVFKPGQQQQHLHHLGGVDAMGSAELLNAGGTRCGQGLTGAPLANPTGQGHGLGRQGDGPLLVGGVGAVATGEDQVFAGVGGHHELLAGGAADGAAVGLDRHGPQAAAAEDAPVGLVHGAIGGLQAGLVGVEGIGVLHDELAPPHQAKPRPDLIAEFGLDLIEIHRQLPVGAQQIRRQGGDHLLMGGAQPQVATLAILQVEHDPLAVGVAGPAAAALPELGGLQLGQQGFQGAGGIELLAHHGGDLLQHPPEQGQIGVDAAAHAADVTGPQQQLVGGDLRFGRVVPKRHQHQAGDAHRTRGER